MTTFQSFRKWLSLPIALLISVLLVFVQVPEKEVKRPCVGKLSGYVKISFDKGIDCNGDTIPLDTMRLTKLLRK
jgi:hypothetical protein